MLVMFMQAVFTAIIIILPMVRRLLVAAAEMLVPLVPLVRPEVLGDPLVQLDQLAQKAHKVPRVILVVLQVLQVQPGHKVRKVIQGVLLVPQVHLVTQGEPLVLLEPKAIRVQQEPLDLQEAQVPLDHVVPLV